MRTYHAIQQSFQRVPHYRLFAAQYDDPIQATAMYERENALAKLEEQNERKGFESNGDI